MAKVNRRATRNLNQMGCFKVTKSLDLRVGYLGGPSGQSMTMETLSKPTSGRSLHRLNLWFGLVDCWLRQSGTPHHLFNRVIGARFLQFSGFVEANH